MKKVNRNRRNIPSKQMIQRVWKNETVHNWALVPDPYGASFEWRAWRPRQKHWTQWNPSTQQPNILSLRKGIYINYIVEDREALPNSYALQASPIVDQMESYDYGVIRPYPGSGRQ